MTGSEATIFAAIISSSVAIFVVVARDLILEKVRDNKRRQREIIDRKLSHIYGPLWLAFGGEEGQFGNVLANKEILTVISNNFHLLSPELQDIFSRYILVGNWSSGEFQVIQSERKKILEISPILKNLLKSEITQLQAIFREL